MIPDSNDPRAWLQSIDELRAEHERFLLWDAERAVDGEAATIRRACDAALGQRAPMFVELDGGRVLELGQDDGDP